MTASQIRKCDKHVFLLGAGFSAAYGVPVMRDFMAVARRRYFPLRERNPHDPLVECYERMMVFQQECRKCSWVFNRDWDNIEELYTQADLLRLARYPDELKAEELCRQIAWVIWDVYRDYHAGKYPPMGEVVDAVCSEDYRPVVITTNYDVLCEIGIQGENSQPGFFYPGFRLPWTPVNRGNALLDSVLEEDTEVRIEAQKGSKVVPVVKLHGSANWFRYDNGKKLFATTQFGTASLLDGKVVQLTGISRPDLNSKTIKAWGNAVCADMLEDPVPAIIPPMLGKMSISPAISHQWKSAIACLDAASRITVIGYSFPETDAFMTRLLAEGLKHNNGLEEITIVDIQAEEQWAERLERMFATTLRQTKLRFQNSDSKAFLGSFAKNKGQ